MTTSLRLCNGCGCTANKRFVRTNDEAEADKNVGHSNYACLLIIYIYILKPVCIQRACKCRLCPSVPPWRNYCSVDSDAILYITQKINSMIHRHPYYVQKNNPLRFIFCYYAYFFFFYGRAAH